MAEQYRGITIPEYTDAADGPTSFKQLVDSGPLPRFANSAERDSALTSPANGATCYVVGSGIQYYDGSAWQSATSGGIPGAHTHNASDINAGVLTTARLPVGSTASAGILQLTNSTTSTSTTTAATPAAVKLANDNAGHAHPYLPLAGGTVTGVTQFSAEVTFGQRIVANQGMKVANYKVDVFQLQVRDVMVTDSFGNVGDQTGKAGDMIAVYNAGANSGLYIRTTFSGGVNGGFWFKAAGI